MKNYLTRNENEYSSSHPQVDKIWAWGGGNMQPKSLMYHHVSIVLKDGTECHFGPNELPIDTDTQVNNFLNTIPE